MTSFYNRYISSLFRTDLRLFEVSVWLQTFAQSLISVFIPIILWKFGLNLTHIIIFYILFNILDVPLNLLARKLIEERGARFTVILGIAAQIIYFVILYNLSGGWIGIFFLALALAVFDSFYWVGHLYIFSGAVHKSSMLRNDVAGLKNIRIFAALLAPLAGSLILTYSDQKTLIFISTLLMFTALLPLFKMRHLKFIPEKKAMRFKEFFSNKIERANYLFISIAAIRQETEEVIWPFFLFFAFTSFQTVAFVPTLLALVELMLIPAIGRLSIKKNIYRFISYGAFTAALVWLFRVGLIRFEAVSNEYLLLGTTVVIALMTILIEVPLEISIFQRAKETDGLAAVTYMNMLRMLTRAFFYVLLLLFGTYFKGAFALVIAAMLALAYLTLKYKRNSVRIAKSEIMIP